uniref:Solute carrier family 22 member 13-like n=1 Tax=Xiphophorus maculatus TaxID=8083 RepID=A0A3B5QJV0_XIPMA
WQNIKLLLCKLLSRYGKRPVLLACACVQAFCGLVPAVFPQPLLFLAIRCLTAVCCCCINICAFSLAVEWTLPAARLWPPAFLPFCFSLGTMGGAPLAWLSPSWTYLHLLLALPQIVCLPLYLYAPIPESPRWLLLRRRKDQQLLLLLHPVFKIWCSVLLFVAPSKSWPSSGSFTISARPSGSMGLVAATALTYYGICLNIGSFGVGVYAAQFFSGLSEAPCLLVPLIRIGRRLISMLALFLSGTACLVSLLLSRYDGTPALVMSLALLGKLCILAATFISVLYCIELFPTGVRQLCISLVNLSYRLGCLVTTFVPPSPSGAISLAAMIVYSSGAIVGCGLCLLLPETSGVPLPDSLEDCNRQPKNHSRPRTELVLPEKVDIQTPNTPFL